MKNNVVSEGKIPILLFCVCLRTNVATRIHLFIHGFILEYLSKTMKINIAFFSQRIRLIRIYEIMLFACRCHSFFFQNGEHDRSLKTDITYVHLQYDWYTIKKMYVRGLRKIRIFFTIQLCSLIFVMGLRAASRPRRGREGRMLSPSLSRYFYVLLFPSSFSGSDVVWRNMSESKPFDGIMPKCREYTHDNTPRRQHTLSCAGRDETHMTWHDVTWNMTGPQTWP